MVWRAVGHQVKSQLFQQEELERPEREREVASSTNTPEKSSSLSPLAMAYKMTNLECSNQ